MEFSILGPLDAVDDGASVDLAGGKQTALLAFLLLQAGRVVPMDRLVDGLWGEDVPESAPKMVQIFVSQLRKRLPRGLIQTRSPGYRLELDGHTLDLQVFEELHARGREALAAGRSDEAARELRRALDLWRGVPLAEFAEPFARLEEARLVEQQLTCLEERVDAELALGREAELVAELEALVRRHPLRERPRGQLMLALYRCGRHAEALEAFQRFRRTLDDELGIDPPPRLKELQRRMLQQDRSLDLVSTERAPAPDTPPATAASMPPPPILAESRKLVTVLVADVRPTHALDDPEAQRAALLERTRAAEQELAGHGASVAGFGGGRVLGVFGVPTARDDDALRAVTAAVALRSSGLAARMGLSTGEVVTGDPLVAGTPVDEAARLQERAGAGDVLASPRTWRAVRHAVEASQREDGWAVDSVDTQAAPLVRRLETPLVGRERELREITKSFESAVGAGLPGLVTVFGAPGLGKTRLAAECVVRLQSVASAAVTHCRADGRDDTYAPLRDLLSELADDDPAAWLRRRLGTDDAPHLANQLAVAVGFATGTAHAEDAALATRRLLAGLAGERPLLLVVEDVHWAAPAFLDLVESVVELAHAPDPGAVPGASRPARPQAALGRRAHEQLDDAARRVARAGIGDAPRLALFGSSARRRRTRPHPRDRRRQSALHRAAARRRARRRPRHAPGLDPDAAGRAPRPARRGRSSRHPGGGGVRHIVHVRRGIGARRRGRGRLAGDARPEGAHQPRRGRRRRGWRLVVPARPRARRRLRRRAEVASRRAARAPCRARARGRRRRRRLGGAPPRHGAARARETGEGGEAVDRLAQRAAVHLRRAGLAAFDRDDWSAASSLLARACELLPRDARERVELLPKLGEALVWRGERGTARDVLAEAHAVATEIGDARLAVRARLATALALMWGEGPVPPDRMLRDVEDAVPVLERARDYGALAMAELVRFHALDRSRLPSSEERLSLALDYARKANEREIEHRVMSWICITLPGGSVPVDDAIRQVQEIAEVSTSAYVYASARGALGLLRAASGEFEQARALVEETRQALEELGLWVSAAGHSIAVAEVELMAADDAAAERVLRSGFETLARSHDELSRANVAWRLGLLLARQGRSDEAERFAHVAERVPTPGLWVDVGWRIVLALVEANRGHTAEALRLVGEARAGIASASGPGSRMEADALIECAEVLRKVGQTDEAAELVGEAAGIAERLGYVGARRRVQRALTA